MKAIYKSIHSILYFSWKTILIKNSNAFFTLFVFIFSTNILFGQTIIDSCFTSVNPNISFGSSSYLANASNADLVEWTSWGWVGAWPTANLTIPPPTNAIGCRAIFIGSAIQWTGGGEGFGLKLTSSLIAGNIYSFSINYVSHGLGSDSAFGPSFYTSSGPFIGNFVGNLPAVGINWTTNTFTFIASNAQAGDDWIIISTSPNGSSGLIGSFCASCNNISDSNCNVNLGNDTTLCQGSTLQLDATTPNATYLWQDNSTSPTFNVIQQGSYWVKVTVNNCSATDNIQVNYNPTPIVNLGNDTTLCQGSTLQLDATTPNATYFWQDNSTSPTFSLHQQGSYWVEVTANNCSVTDTISIHMDNCDLIMPNAFSPNNDGLNDEFKIIKNFNIQVLNFSIYNRWGQVVFTSDGDLFGWDGKFKGKICDIGTYYYLVKYKPLNRLNYSIKTGDLELIR